MTAPRPGRMWPWLIAGTAVGVLVAWATWSGGAKHPRDGVWRPGISRPQFETYLRLSRIPTAPPVFRDLVIYPPAADGSVYVAGSYLPNLAVPGRYRAFEFVIPRDERWGDSTSVRSYIAAGFPRVSFRYAWWASPVLTSGISFFASLLIVGIGIPLTLRRLVPASTIRTSEASAHADDFKAEPRAAEDEGDSSAAALTDDACDSRAVPVLHGEQLSAPLPPDEQSPKDYRGEFYPVARPGGTPAAPM